MIVTNNHQWKDKIFDYSKFVQFGSCHIHTIHVTLFMDQKNLNRIKKKKKKKWKNLENIKEVKEDYWINSLTNDGINAIR